MTVIRFISFSLHPMESTSRKARGASLFVYYNIEKRKSKEESALIIIFFILSPYAGYTDAALRPTCPFLFHNASYRKIAQFSSAELLILCFRTIPRMLCGKHGNSTDFSAAYRCKNTPSAMAPKLSEYRKTPVFMRFSTCSRRCPCLYFPPFFFYV